MNIIIVMARILPPASRVNRVPSVRDAGQRSPKMTSPPPASLPKNYRLIYDIVEKSGLGRHLRPAEIYMKALERRPGIGLTTVYRALERLRELGIVSELRVPGSDAAVYEPSGPRHAHFRCSECGAIEDVAYVVPARTVNALARQHGFQIENERVTFEGRCASCSGG